MTTFPIPHASTATTTDLARDEMKRERSPASFFFAQSQVLPLAAKYFTDARLVKKARSGVSIKHRHRINLALFGQLMAAFEYLLKDFVAQIVDATDLFDDRLAAAKWVAPTVPQIVAQRTVSTSPGRILIHPTQGWHRVQGVNDRYSALFERCPIDGSEFSRLEVLWIIRHTSAHNAGVATHYDASRIGDVTLSQRRIEITSDYFDEAVKFLRGIARRCAEDVGNHVLHTWLQKRAMVPQYAEQVSTYERLKSIATCVPSRTGDLPDFGETDYLADRTAAGL